MNYRNNSPNKVLLINTFGIGDVLFTTPLISSLKENFPEGRIGYVCNRRTAFLLENNDKVDNVFIYERDEFNAAYCQSRFLYFKKVNELLRRIKDERYGTVIDMSLNSVFSFLCYFVGIKERVGLNYKKRSLFLTKKINLEGFENKHVVEYYLSLLTALGWKTERRGLELTISDSDNQWVDNFFKEKRLDPKTTIIGLVPGGGASWGKEAVYRRWSVEKYAKLADKLIEKFSAQIILMGDENEKDLCSNVSRLMRNNCYLTCGQTTISQFAALTKRCSLNIVNDGGPLHIAVAAGARTVSIFGPVDENIYGPYPIGKHSVVRKDLACRPCYRSFRRANCDHVSCLNSITVHEVLERVEGAL